MPEYEIQIGRDGRVKAEVKGSHGEPCLALADALTELLGREESLEHTPEYYGSASIQTQSRESQQARVNET